MTSLLDDIKADRDDPAYHRMTTTHGQITYRRNRGVRPASVKMQEYGDSAPLDAPITRPGEILPPPAEHVPFSWRNEDERHNNWCHAFLWFVLMCTLAVAIVALFLPHMKMPSQMVPFNGTCLVDPDDQDTVVCANADDTVSFQHDGTLYGLMHPNGANERGVGVSATGANSHAGGRDSLASGDAAFAHGFSGAPSPPPSTPINNCSVQFELPTDTSFGVQAAADGSWALGWASGSSVLLANATGSSAQGMAESASFIMSLMPGAHSEGCALDNSIVVAVNKGAHAEGYASNSSSLIASGIGAHVEGWVEGQLCSKASGDGSHAEGYATTAEGTASHAEGWKTRALGDYSHAEGYGSGGTPPVLCSFFWADPEDPLVNISGPVAPFDGVAYGLASHAEGWLTQANNRASHGEGFQTVSDGDSGHSEGICNWAYGTGSHAEGGKTGHFECITDNSPSEFWFYQKHGGNYAIGDASHAEGTCTQAVKRYAHAEGIQTRAVGVASHTEGQNSVAEGEGSHTEGRFTYTAPGAPYSHVEGKATITSAGGPADYYGAYAEASHVEGSHSVARPDAYASHVSGVGGIAYLSAMWAHGFRATPGGGNDGFQSQPQVLKYSQSTTTLDPIPVNITLPVTDTRSTLWAGRLTIVGLSDTLFGGTTPLYFHEQYQVTVGKVSGVETLLEVTQIGTTHSNGGLWVSTPSATVTANATFVTVEGDGTDAPPGSTVTWGINWEVWDMYAVPGGVII